MESTNEADKAGVTPAAHSHDHDHQDHDHHDHEGHDHDHDRDHAHDQHDQDHGNLEHDHDHDHRHEHGEDHDDWNNEDFVEGWLERQKERAPERRRQFAVVRALLPKAKNAEFRYLNLGAGPGNLDEVLLEHFPGANAVLVDTSFVMLSRARSALARFGDRVEYVQADLRNEEWAGAIGGPFDAVVSSFAIHHLGDPRRIRSLYREVNGLLGHGGIFINLEYLRPAKPFLSELGNWAAKDEEAGLRGGGGDFAGTMTEQLGWLVESGFPEVDVAWKNINVAAFVAIRDHLHLPAEAGESDHDHGHEHGHSH